MTHEEAMREGLAQMVREARVPPPEGRHVPQAWIDEMIETSPAFAEAYRAEWDRQSERKGALAERERIVQLAESEADKLRNNTDFMVNSTVAAALEDFAELLKGAS